MPFQTDIPTERDTRRHFGLPPARRAMPSEQPMLQTASVSL
ncbi:TPA: hypothetical protein ACLA6K_000426 [Neisseria meningitidis]